ncbi:hypothetical protein PG985_007151 [Apiospora marii]|uniref:Uncharacterized protein n=1 Tax=Apiospora marii TaxID=335849 RepID=A0ABR1SEW3_9PEZI
MCRLLLETVRNLREDNIVFTYLGIFLPGKNLAWLSSHRDSHAPNEPCKASVKPFGTPSDIMHRIFTEQRRDLQDTGTELDSSVGIWSIGLLRRVLSFQAIEGGTIISHAAGLYFTPS